MKKQTEIVVVILVTLGYMRFFEPVFVSNRILNYAQFLSVFAAVVLGGAKLFENTRRFRLPVIMLLVSIIISMFMGMFYWDQSLKHTLLSTYEHLIVFFFFFIASSKITIRDFEKVIFGLGFVYLIFFAIQYASLPNIMFGKSNWGTDEFVERRGTIRFVFPSAGIFFLMSFMAFTKMTQKARPKILFWALSFLGILLPIIQVTRQFIAASILIFSFDVTKNISWGKRALLLVSLLIGIQFLLSSDIEIVQGLLEQSKSDITDGANYIRVEAAEFFLFEFSPNWVTSIFGNGVPYWNMSDYGIYIALLQHKYGFYLEDVGLIGYYAQIGIFGALSFILIWIYSFIYPLPNKYSYLKYYLWFLLLTGLTWYSIYHYHYLLITTMVLGMYQKLTRPKTKDKATINYDRRVHF